MSVIVKIIKLLCTKLHGLMVSNSKKIDLHYQICDRKLTR